MNFDPRLYQQIAEHPYPLMFVTICGAHLYGFPSVDSDFDMRGVHLLPLAEIVGLIERDETVERSGFRDGPERIPLQWGVPRTNLDSNSPVLRRDTEVRPALEIDLVTHDAKKFLGLMLRKMAMSWSSYCHH
jgi:predicted nucleotidyltransferase